MPIDFRECPVCNGYGIKDNGETCKECKGSGERMFDRETGRQITHKELIKMSKNNLTAGR